MNCNPKDHLEIQRILLIERICELIVRITG
jgi:hypothetical protein